MTAWKRAKALSLKLVNALTCFIRKLWRPLALVGVAAGTWVNIVYIPLKTGAPVNLTEGAAWIAALGGLSWVREWGKVKGNSDNG